MLGEPGREMIATWHRTKCEQSDWGRRMGRSVLGFWQHTTFSTAVLYGSLALFTSVLHNVFLLYYVETFVSVYKIDKVSFWVGEVRVLYLNAQAELFTCGPGVKSPNNAPHQWYAISGVWLVWWPSCFYLGFCISLRCWFWIEMS